MIKNLKENLWKISFKLFGSEVYLLKLKGKNILIDTSSILNRRELKKSLEELKLPLEKIDIVLLTHNHFDHAGNIRIFKNAKIYGEYEDFKNKKVHNPFIPSLQKFKTEDEEERKAENILPLEKLNMPEIQVMKTPGHTKGSVVFYMPKEKILFSGDTVFERGIGRTDLPNSAPEKMSESLEKVRKLDVKLLCPGHDY